MQTVADGLRQGMALLNQVDDAVVESLKDATPEDLAEGYKEVLNGLLSDVLKDDTGLMKRQAKIQMIYLLDRFSEKLQDLLKLGKILKGSELMQKIERAHFFATRIASIKDKGGSSLLIKEYDQSVQPISMLDPISAEQKEDRRSAVRSDYADFARRFKGE